MFDHRTPQRRGALRHRWNGSIVSAAIVALVATFSIGVATAAAAETTMVPACSGINIRTGPSTAHAVKATLGANATLTVVAKVSGGSWRTSCPTAKAGTTWYRVSAIDGRTVQATYNVAYLYAAAGVLIAAPPSPPISPPSTTDGYANHLMRLINLDREALGLKPYLIDGRLAEIARNAPFTCPTDQTKSFKGRARDMADRNYFAHTVPGCFSSGTTPFRSIEIARRVFGYTGARSEILHWNRSGTTTTTYRLGCDINGTSCAGGTTSAPYRVTLAQRSFMSSAPHRAAELNSYQRFGCGTAVALVPGTNKTYFACLFADGGSTLPVTPPAAAATIMAPACADVNLRTGPSTARAVKARLGTSARVTVVANVSGGHWSATCAGPKSGTTWARISAIDGRTVMSRYGVTWLYAAAGLLKKPS
ncbi:MAG TPA: hypothetical protein VF119_03500 [Candidatus Limnocylindrales bacterium]